MVPRPQDALPVHTAHSMSYGSVVLSHEPRAGAGGAAVQRHRVDPPQLPAGAGREGSRAVPHPRILPALLVPLWQGGGSPACCAKRRVPRPRRTAGSPGRGRRTRPCSRAWGDAPASRGTSVMAIVCPSSSDATRRQHAQRSPCTNGSASSIPYRLLREWASTTPAVQPQRSTVIRLQRFATLVLWSLGDTIPSGASGCRRNDKGRAVSPRVGRGGTQRTGRKAGRAGAQGRAGVRGRPQPPLSARRALSRALPPDGAFLPLPLHLHRGPAGGAPR